MNIRYRLAVLWTFLFLAYGTLWAVHSDDLSNGAGVWAGVSTAVFGFLAALHWVLALHDATDAAQREGEG